MRTHPWAAWILGAVVAGIAPVALAGGGSPAAPPVARPTSLGTVSGLVTDEEGKPLAGARVRVHVEGVEKPMTATSDAKGFYAVRGLPVGPARVTVQAQGRIAVSRQVAVPATGIAVADACLRPGVRFAGKVVDLEGAPVGEVRVFAFQGGDGGAGDLRSFFALSVGDSTTSKADGTYELDGVAPGASYTLRFVHPRYRTVDLPGLDATPGGGHASLEAILEDAAWVTGTVVGSDGKPIAGADVSGGEDPFSVGSSNGWISIFMSLADEDATPPTDAKGRFRVGSLTEEAVTLRVRADGHFATTLEVAGLTPGVEKGGVTVRLETATATVEGLVVDDRGQPVAGARVNASSEGDVVSTATSNAAGKFKLTRVASREPVRLGARAPGHAEGATEGVALDAKEARIECRRLGRLQVAVRGADGKPLRQVLVRALVGGNERGTSAWVVPQGDLVTADLPLGEVDLELSGEGYEPTSLGRFDVEPGESVTPDPVTLAKAAEAPAQAPSEDDDEDDDGG